MVHARLFSNLAIRAAQVENATGGLTVICFIPSSVWMQKLQHESVFFLCVLQARQNDLENK